MPELALQELVEHALIFEALLLIDGVDAGAHGFRAAIAARRRSSLRWGADGVRLHLHEIGERVVEIEDDRSNQTGPPRGTRSIDRRGRAIWPRPDAAPEVISPLSMRMLNPHAGLLHTQAL